MISSDRRDADEPPDPARDKAWIREARSRLAAYDAGLMEAFDAEDVLAEFDHIGDDPSPGGRGESPT